MDDGEEQALVKESLSVLREASGQPVVGNPGEDGLGTLRQGYLEDSSVDPVRPVVMMQNFFATVIAALPVPAWFA